ncbi:B12-binding domain-containing radical SAM protein [Heliophilum fasciatum]|uniref:Radical SAM superfamily enzyme YgiQ (UPF0313 family) n=1 Tax=Heliophilum fasciatum TaxID=35700 RepID=A0A4R2RYC1_9FIRM|nr:radical SAM protein [Heliophilum fasciatum]MCW2278809.1 radical SAM superfamily enzyme YgiQ (UPF0313 family) [Heliophilum fasciatum]TCP64105.1 radical SAM superfamily enzyme YgiQ (UPF0313 family) [Heliophilum fasciatum]
MTEHITQEFLNLIKLPDIKAKRLNYLFVMPRIVTRDDMTYQLPYGFCMVSSALKASGRSVVTLNLNYKANPYELLRQTIIDNSIDVVATGGLSGQYSLLKAITDTVKSVNPEVITIVGGGIITAEPDVAMAALGTADYGIIGEGEITINALAYALEKDEDVRVVEGIVLRDGTVTQLRSEIANLDILPFPDYDGFEYSLLLRDKMFSSSGVNEKTAIVTTGRSCPFNCTFCFHSSGKKYRRRSIDNIFQEINWIISKYDIKYIMFVDELFVKDERFVKEVTKRIKKLDVKYWVQTRVDMITKEILLMLKDSGCYEITYGVESADNNILKSMQKNITVEQIERAFNLSREVGLPAKGYIIFGDLEETAETISNSLRWWRAHPEFDIRLWWILTFPGSYLYKVACERGLISDRVQYLKNNDTQLNISKMSDEQYWEMVKKVELFQMLSSDGVNINFEDIDNVVGTISKNLDNLLKEHEIAVWPATLDIITMLGYISSTFVCSDKVVLINTNPNDSYVLGTERFGKKVYTPDEILTDRNVDTVLYAFGHRSSHKVRAQISEMIKNQYPNVKQIINISGLLKNVI